MALRRSATRAGAAAVGLVVLAGGLAACGDPVTGPHDWRVIGHTSLGGGASNGVGYQTRTFRAGLLNGKGSPVPGTLFAEQCSVYASGYITPVTCLLIVNTGAKVYVAKGTPSSRLSLFGTFKTLDGKGTITVSSVPTLMQGAEEVLVQARPIH